MVILGLLMIIGPILFFLVTIPVSSRLRPPFRRIYRFVGGGLVGAGGTISICLAAYAGDQGGISAYFFQIAVICSYLFFCILIMGLNWMRFGKKMDTPAE